MIKETAAGSAETKPTLPTNEEESVEQKGQAEAESNEVEMLFREDQALGSLAERVLRFTAEEEKAEAALAEAKRTTAIAKADLISKMIEQKIEKSFQALGKTFTRKEEVHPSYNKANEEQVFEWLREIGQGSAIKETVHHQTFGAIIRELDAEKAELPEFIKVFREWKLYIRQGSAK